MKRLFLILSCSVWDVSFSCLVLESVYYNVEMCMMFDFVLLGSFCVPFTNPLIKFYFITIVINNKSVGTTRLFIGQQHPITVYRTGFWVCVVLVLSVICVPLANLLMKLYFIMITILLCIIPYETKFSHSFLFGLRCIFQLPGSGICIL